MAVVASGDWWTLDDEGLLSIFCVGNMPEDSRPWSAYAGQITAVEIADGVTSIADEAFDSHYGNYSNLASVTIPDNVASIGSAAFSGCVALTNIALPRGLTVISSCAFSACSSLHRIFIPDSVTNIGEGAFYECEALAHVYYAGTRAQWESIAIHGEGAEEEGYGYENLLSAKIHFNSADFPMLIPPGAFPVTVRYTSGGQTFATSFSLEMAESYCVITPPTKTAYSRTELLDYTGLVVTERFFADNASVNITTQCEFNPAEGTEVTETGVITVSVNSGGKARGTFRLLVKSANVIASGDGWALYDDGVLEIFCAGDMPDYEDLSPSDSSRYWEFLGKYGYDGANYYITSAPWDIYNHDLYDGNYRGYDEEEHFIRDRLIDTVYIWQGVTAIGNFAFAYLPLRNNSVTIPDSVTRIGDYAFYSSQLSSVVIPNSVKEIGEYAFYDTYLEAVTISRDCEVGHQAFPSNCTINYY